jgi:azurin
MTRHIALFALLLATGCSSQPATDAASPAAPAGTPPTATTAVSHDGRAVEISANDSMKFTVTELTAKPGEKLSVTLVNTGTTPKFSMGHNWVLLAAGTDVQAFVVAAAEAVTTDYLPGGPHKASVVAATKLLGPKERDTATFTAPTTPGRYEFVCSFPGHLQVGMRGVLIVE